VHRSPLCMLVLGAALAACSTRDDPRSGELLSQDSTLVARLDVGRDAHQVSLPDACRTIVAAATPAVVNKPQADTLTRQAYDAEILGNVKEARTLFRRASELDGTNKTTVYHLGRASEALGDRGAAIGAYCRYLALAPTATEAAEARQRVASLSTTAVHAASGGASDSVAKSARRGSARVAASQPVTARPMTARPVRVQREPTRSAPTPTVTTQRVATRRATREQPAAEPRVGVKSADDATSSTAATGKVEQVGGQVDTASGGEVVATTTTREPSVDQSSTDSRAASRGPSRTQSAGIGAAAGAILGAATGRGVKGALIGAAAGGILGSAVGGGR
jgi:hypothetical protein